MREVTREEGFHVGIHGRRREAGAGADLSEVDVLLYPRPIVVAEARSGRNHVAQDDVLLETHEEVLPAGDGRLGQNLRRLLETRRGDERIRGQGRLGNPEQQRRADGGLLAVLPHALVLAAEQELVHGGPGQEVRVARFLDLHFAHHLAHDDLDVLVVDRHAL